jgi:hypothetical protein
MKLRRQNHFRTTSQLSRSTSPVLLPFLQLLLRNTLAFEPVAVEAMSPERARSARCRVVGLALLSCGAVDAAPGGGILIGRHGVRVMGGRRMRPTTVRAPYTFGSADGRVMAPL